MSIPDQRRRRIVGDEGKRVEGNYILWGILGSEIWGWMPFLSPTSAKDIHWNSSFLQPPTDSRGKGRFYAPFYVCSQTSEPTPICVQMLFLYFCTGWTSLFTVLYLCRNAVIEFHPSTRAFNSTPMKNPGYAGEMFMLAWTETGVDWRRVVVFII